jgi:hypothetical protein
MIASSVYFLSLVSVSPCFYSTSIAKSAWSFSKHDFDLFIDNELSIVNLNAQNFNDDHYFLNHTENCCSGPFYFVMNMQYVQYYGDFGACSS